MWIYFTLFADVQWVLFNSTCFAEVAEAFLYHYLVHRRAAEVVQCNVVRGRAARTFSLMSFADGALGQW